MSSQVENRSAAPRLTIFNHKGGVGKTTLTVNLAFAVADLGYSVLLVDSDPQCNLSSYLVDEEVLDDLLDSSDDPKGKTLWTALKPVAQGLGEHNQVSPLAIHNAINLLVGDIRLSEYESELSPLWTDCFARKLRGFRGMASLSSVVNSAANDCGADIIIYDTGPNIGALNRAILLDCDYFAIPAACDLFSVRAIQTLGQTMSSWIRDWRTIQDLAPEGIYSLPGLPKPIGYIPQRFRIYDSRPAKAFAEWVPRIENAVRDDLLTLLKRVDESLISAALAPLLLAAVPDFGSRAAIAQRRGVALWQLDQATHFQRNAAYRTFTGFAKNIGRRVGLRGLA